MRKSIVSVFLLALLLCGLFGCSLLGKDPVKGVISLLEGVSAAVETASAEFISPTSTTAADFKVVNDYIALAATNIPKAIAIIQGSSKNLNVVSTQVIALLSEISQAPVVSSHLSARQQMVIQGVAATAKAFLDAFANQTAGVWSTKPEFVMAFNGAANKPLKLSAKYKKTLAGISSRMSNVAVKRAELPAMPNVKK